MLDKSGNVTEIGTVTKNSANEFTWTLPEGVGINETVKIDDSINTNNIKVNIVNSRNINSSGTTANSGNGIYSFLDSGTSTIGNIINSGTISGNGAGGDNSGNGIYFYLNSGSTIGDIINNGTISGSTTSNGTYSGNGIHFYSATIGDIINYGIISGKSNGGNNSGNGIFSYSDISSCIIGNITNYGTISGSTTSNGNDSGNGIHSFYEAGTSIIGNIINSGTISGESTGGDDSGNGIFSYSPYYASTIGNILNHGNINGTTTGNGNNSGNAIYSYSEGETSIIGNITNGGIISGNGADGYNSGNGVYSHSDTDDMSSIIGNITNSGTISGNGAGGDNSGNGIFAYSGDTSSSSTTTSSSTIGNITNYGIISGEGTGRTNSGSGILSYSVNGVSSIGNITNYGIISGKNNIDGNGIYAYSTKEATIGDIANYGAINGRNGILSYSDSSYSMIGNIVNFGIISGTWSGIHAESSGGNVAIGDITNNGIISSISTFTDSTSTIGNIINRGNIVGEIKSFGGEESTIKSISNSGTITEATYTGISSSSFGEKSTIESISNSGVIMGSQSGIYISGDSNSGIANYNNYGLVIGQIPVEMNGIQKDNPEEQGMAITIDTSGDISSVDCGTGGKAGIYSIINTTLQNGGVDAYNEYTTDENISNSIINGAGVASGTVTIEADKNFSLNGGIINAYKTAVTVKDGASFTGTDVTINGGGLDGTALVISGSAGANTVNISGNSFINGDIDLKGTGDGDTLDFGSAVTKGAGSDNINLFHKISNVESININQKVTAFETSEITGADKINIGKNGELVLRIDGANSNKHALSNGNSSGTIDSDGGKLLLALNGVSDGSTIDMGIKLGDGIYGVENPDIKYRDLFTLETTSYLHSISKTSDTEVKVETKSTLPLSYINYDKLNKIYQSMQAVDGITQFNVPEEKFSSFIGYLNDIYAGNPYSYSSELSRKSMGMFRDIVTENSFKADTGKWMIYGGLTHIDGGTKDTYYGKGYYTYDIGSSDMDADTKITGAYMLGEYGVSDTLTSGVVIGGNKLKSDLSNGSKVDGSAMYLGAYAKKYIGNLKVTGGAGFQYGDYDADRIATGYSGITETRNYSSSYNDLTYDIYLNGRYSHNIGDNLYLEPYTTLSYTYVKQDGADEGNKTLAIKTNSKSFDYTVGKMGVDLKKVIPHEKGKSTLSAGVSYTKILDGADEEYITGTFKGKLLDGKSAKNFDILVAHKNEHSLGLNAKYTLELENGILFDVKGSYAVERDSHNQSGKNKTKGE
ncbi:autotransporter domain-containing protein, partial [Fusobacterium varium]|uniref:autotransporter domain-containing protein n=1 Tax=Fusobacterium varium TaxID=856 RepID=UPI0038B25F80